MSQQHKKYISIRILNSGSGYPPPPPRNPRNPSACVSTDSTAHRILHFDGTQHVQAHNHFCETQLLICGGGNSLRWRTRFVRLQCVPENAQRINEAVTAMTAPIGRVCTLCSESPPPPPSPHQTQLTCLSTFEFHVPSSQSSARMAAVRAVQAGGWVARSACGSKQQRPPAPRSTQQRRLARPLPVAPRAGLQQESELSAGELSEEDQAYVDQIGNGELTSTCACCIPQPLPPPPPPTYTDPPTPPPASLPAPAQCAT